MGSRWKKDRSSEASTDTVSEVIKNSPMCSKCNISSALCDCPSTPCECGHALDAHRSGRACRGCKCRRYVAAEGFLSDFDRVRLAKDLLGLMRNLWADETEEMVRRAILAERRRMSERLRAMPSESESPNARVAYADACTHAADVLDAEGGTEATGGIRVYRTSSRQRGGCSFCNRHITPHGESTHHVTVVESGSRGGGITVRFCDQCVLAFRVATVKVTR